MRKSTSLPALLVASSVLLSGATAYGGETLDYASEELNRFAPEAVQAINLRLNKELPEFSYAYARSVGKVSIEAATETGLLQGLYTVLEHMGYRFEVTGPIAPPTVSLDAVPEGRQVVTPTIQRRGVRQHINFNMDISGYPLEEAKEYIRNLARLRYNFITFHSYPGHWTWDKRGQAAQGGDYSKWTAPYKFTGDTLVCGGFFYGTDFPIPDHPVIRPAIRFNKAYFCAPEFEEVIHKHPERGQKAQEWLRAVIAEARRCGMWVNFSTELWSLDDAYNLDLVSRIVKDYPLINSLELNSAESGDFRDDKDAEVNRAMAEEIIKATGGETAALIQKYWKGPVRPPAPYGRTIRDKANIIRMIRLLQNQQWEEKTGVELICGSYATAARSYRVEMDLIEKYLKPTQIVSIMPGHSALKANRTLFESEIKPELLARTIIHSWIEFDGSMMLQQHTASAIDELDKYICSRTGKPSYGIVCNHWRTAPNGVSFRYLSERALNPNLSPAQFYAAYASRLGIPDAKAPDLAKVMSTLDGLSDANAISMNCGFPLSWTVDPKTGGFKSVVWWWSQKNMTAGRDRMDECVALLKGCREASDSESGKKILSQLITGCELSSEHLSGVLELKKITDKFYDKELKTLRSDLTAEDRTFILEQTNKADRHMQNYTRILASNLGDRGEEGLLMTYYWGPVVFVNNLRKFYTDTGRWIERAPDQEVVPLPLTVEDEKQIGIQAGGM